jgi:hypothetical protein
MQIRCPQRRACMGRNTSSEPDAITKPPTHKQGQRDAGSPADGPSLPEPKRLYANERPRCWQAADLRCIIAKMGASKPHSDDDLLAYLDEMLPADRTKVLEADLRGDETLRVRLASVSRRRDQGVHSVGEIWRRLRLSCPTRSQLGSFLLGTLAAPQAEYVEFHLRSVGCRICTANLHDLELSMKSSTGSTERRRRFFESSAGRLRDLSSRRL